MVFDRYRSVQGNVASRMQQLRLRPPGAYAHDIVQAVPENPAW